jgi:hypothetical protein
VAVDSPGPLPQDRSVAKIATRGLRIMVDRLQEFLRSQLESSSRSSAMGNANWLIGILVTATVGLVKYGAPTWMQAGFLILDVGFVGYYAYIHRHFALHNSDALRSEKYHLSKMAIERGLYGDNVRGLIQGDAVSDSPDVPLKRLGSDSEESEHG